MRSLLFVAAAMAVVALACAGGMDHSDHDHSTEEGMKEHNAMVALQKAAADFLNGTQSWTSVDTSYTSLLAAKNKACGETVATTEAATTKASSHDHSGHDHSGHDHGTTKAVTTEAATTKASSHDHSGHDHSGNDHGTTKAVTTEAATTKASSHDHSGHDHDHGGDRSRRDAANSDACKIATAAFGAGETKKATADAACAKQMYDTAKAAEICAGKYCTSGAHSMGDKFVVGASHGAGCPTDKPTDKPTNKPTDKPTDKPTEKADAGVTTAAATAAGATTVAATAAGGADESSAMQLAASVAVVVVSTASAMAL